MLDDRHGFAAHYTRARDLGLQAMADELLDIADDSEQDFDPVTGKVNQEYYQRSRLRVDTRKWYLSKLAPKRYGDRLETRHVGPEGGAIRFSAMSDEELNARLAELQSSPIIEGEKLPEIEKKEDSE